MKMNGTFNIIATLTNYGTVPTSYNTTELGLVQHKYLVSIQYLIRYVEHI